MGYGRRRVCWAWLGNNEKTLARWEPRASELDPGPPTTTFNPREAPGPMAGSAARV
ncbi:hypothetical protein X777_00912 [Ooceraea biroi]|uniref:Uncharacterized protein n=1 Tax=Ooceraea biroi TaxID=2015173 RepID=A0A026WP65_OOCBI|nr:hypothetical protein X777_00912 [Ooceraea biroi]